MSNPLPAVHSLADVAAALGENENYVKERCRRREWPHLRGARGKPSFTDEQYRQILEIRSVAASAADDQRIAFAPRSGRRAS